MPLIKFWNETIDVENPELILETNRNMYIPRVGEIVQIEKLKGYFCEVTKIYHEIASDQIIDIYLKEKDWEK